MDELAQQYRFPQFYIPINCRVQEAEHLLCVFSKTPERLCSIEMFNYELKNISIFKKNGTHLGCYAHKLKDAFPELDNIVFGEKDELASDGSIQPQSLTQEVTDLLMRAIQELSAEVESLHLKR